MYDFKVGDIVLVIANEYGNAFEGKIGIILEAGDHEGICCVVGFNNGRHWACDKSRLVLIERKDNAET